MSVPRRFLAPSITPSLSQHPWRIGLVAGEASSDLLGGALITELAQRLPQAQFAGIGGPAMRQAGCQTWADHSELAVMGFAEVLKHLPRLWRLRQRLQQQLFAWPVDVFVGIDTPDFNLGLEHWLKSRGIATVHYVSPSIWAWKERRAEKMRSAVDLVLCLFPMEPPLYARYQVPARFVGHPMADAIALHCDRDRARATFQFASAAPVLAVLPGSRLTELMRLGPLFLQAAALVAEQLPKLQILIPAATEPGYAQLAKQLAQYPQLADRSHLLHGQARVALVAADIVLVASGTATLETLLVKRPMVVGYQVAPVTAYLIRTLRLLKVQRFALPNLLSGRDLVPEFIQDECTPPRLAAAVLAWFQQPDAQQRLLPHFDALHRELRQNASAQAAKAIVDILQQRSNR